MSAAMRRASLSMRAARACSVPLAPDAPAAVVRVPQTLELPGLSGAAPARSLHGVQFGRERLQLFVLPRDDFSGGVDPLLVVVAKAHQAAGGAEQLLVILQKLLVTPLVLYTTEAAISD